MPSPARQPAMEKLINILKKRELAVIFILLFGIYLSSCFNYMSSTDTIPAILMPFSILDQHNIYFDQFWDYYSHTTNWWGTYFFWQERGHVVSAYPIITPILVTPLYVIPYIGIKLLGIPIDMSNGTFFLLVYAMEKISAGVVAALSGVIFYLVLREMFDRKVSLIGLVIYALGTSTWTIASQGLWQHGISELLICLMLLIIARGLKKPRDAYFILLGLLSGLLVFNRPTNAPLLLPVAYYTIARGRPGGVARYGVALAAVAIPMFAYSFYFFGGPFGAYSSYGPLFGLGMRNLVGLAGLLISPSRGLFIYTPIALLALPGVLYVKRLDDKFLRNTLYLGALGVLGVVFIYTSFECWWGGGCYGPRFFTDLIPFIALGIVFTVNEVLNHDRSGTRTLKLGAIAALLIASVLVQMIGVYLYPVYGFQWGHGQTITVQDQSKLWDWQDTQIGESLDGLTNSSNHGYRYQFNNGTVSVVR